ncbi:TPA: hypothetical protein P4P41_002584 [Enterococcus faecium]|uniref:hypothetical protein n=2 Tax=Enterococcus TaxID=1350 RepID=UPI0002A26F9B|nr:MULTISPECIES: hypothetical protein [Enterococcus]OWW60978.1 hypothetical protein F521_12680 [Enterococcus hirae 67-03-C5]OWW63430.1 hypothetical protein C656_12795 [Enterococcus hirae 57-03-H11]EGP5570228.1 hypothetical protein [Enterococcus faecium]EGP5587808.1 hypothetical protein [Enterococcus faecium]ELB08318.1 hypothetical protein OII_04214 [Enterococcus faecium EnGen0029]
MRLKLYNVYLGVLCIALTLLLVFSRSSLANISLFLYMQKAIKYFFLIVPLIAGLFIKLTRRELIIFPLLLVLAFVGARLTKDTAILQIVILVFGLRGIKVNSLVDLFYGRQLLELFLFLLERAWGFLLRYRY